MQSNWWIPFFPEQASSYAWQVDYLHIYLIVISVVFTIPIVAAIGIFMIRYRERERYATPDQIHGSIMLETVWSIIPFIVAMTIFLGGAVVYYNQYRMPDNPEMQIYVVGKQWMWKIQHETGQREINELHVPVGRTVRLTMTTEDVIHDFGIPAFRTKMDVVPGRYTYMWFQATKPGRYELHCMEYCGLNHAGMGGYIYVMEQRDFDDWLAGGTAGQTPVEAGRELFENRLGCASCHGAGPQQRGPSLNNLFGSQVQLASGQTVTADEEYIRNSILNPAAQVVAGYQPIMPTFKGQVTEEQLMGLVAYIKSMGTGGAATTGNAMTPRSAPAANTAGPANTAANAARAANVNVANGGSALRSNPNVPQQTAVNSNR